MIRKATMEDVEAISRIYEDIHTEEEAGRMTIGWIRGVYPTKETAVTSINKDEMYVEELDGVVTACARINDEQVPEYADAAWTCDAPDDKILVLHTLVVDPACKGQGSGSRFVRFYEEEALRLGRPVLRMDTNARNTAARRMYARLGYREVGIVGCVFNGIPDVKLVCLEKTLEEKK